MLYQILLGSLRIIISYNIKSKNIIENNLQHLPYQTHDNCIREHSTTSGDLRNRGSGDNALERYVLNIYLPTGFISFDQPNIVICQQQSISFVRLKTFFDETCCFKSKQ